MTKTSLLKWSTIGTAAMVTALGVSVSAAVASSDTPPSPVANLSDPSQNNVQTGEYNWPQQPSQYETMPYRGVNIAGADYDDAFHLPSFEDGAFYAEAGMNTIRFPFKWEYLQSHSTNPQDRGNNPADAINWSNPNASAFAQRVEEYTSKGMNVILDMHNYMRYGTSGAIIGSSQNGAATAEQYAAAWKTIAQKFANNSKVSFDLMNEPNRMSSTLLLANYNTAISAIREVTNNPILLEGNGWSGAHSWTDTWVDGDSNPRSNADTFKPANIHDSANNYIINVHQYFDDDFSGTKTECTKTPAISGLSSYLEQNNLTAMVTEMGGPNTAGCAQHISEFLGSLPSRIIGFTGWAGGTPAMAMTQYFGPLGNGNVTVTMTDGYQKHLVRPTN